MLALHQVVTWTTLLHCLLALPLPGLPTPRVVGVDDFSLRRGHHFATILIDALTHRRVDVLPDRTAETLTAGGCGRILAWKWRSRYGSAS